MPRKSIETPAPAARDILVLFPGALGDLLCAWPSLARLADDGALTLVARPAAAAALPAARLTLASIERREVADLFGDAPLAAETRALFGGYRRVESFTAHGDANFAARLARACGRTPALHPFRAMRPGEHASAYYARSLGVAPHPATLAIAAADAAWADALWRTHALGARVLAIHPGSGAARKNWEGMTAAAQAWRAAGGQVLALSGPAESDAPSALEADAALRQAPLPRVAAALRRAQRYLGNDSGISHLAGLVGARGVVVFGDSDPDTWRPQGALRVVHAPRPCPACGPARLCMHRVALDAVREALAAA